MPLPVIAYLSSEKIGEIQVAARILEGHARDAARYCPGDGPTLELAAIADYARSALDEALRLTARPDDDGFHLPGPPVAHPRGGSAWPVAVEIEPVGSMTEPPDLEDGWLLPGIREHAEFGRR